MKTLTAAGLYLWNKSVAIFVLIALMWSYRSILPVTFDPLTGEKSGGMPFADVLFAAILILAVVVIAPFVRLLMFAEASEYAESGKLRREIGHMTITPAMRHYWFATAISFIVTIACLATLAH